MKSKKGAMEMSVGTIVTIVLLVSVLILGIFLVNKIFSSATSAIDITDQQMKAEINKLFSEDKELVIYPTSRRAEVKQDDTDEIGLFITNLVTGVTGEADFSYEVYAKDVSNCGVTEAIAESWIVLGKESGVNPIKIAPGSDTVERVTFKIPVGSPLCVVRYGVNVMWNGNVYASDSFDIDIKAK